MAQLGVSQVYCMYKTIKTARQRRQSRRQPIKQTWTSSHFHELVEKFRRPPSQHYKKLLINLQRHPCTNPHTSRHYNYETLQSKSLAHSDERYSDLFSAKCMDLKIHQNALQESRFIERVVSLDKSIVLPNEQLGVMSISALESIVGESVLEIDLSNNRLGDHGINALVSLVRKDLQRLNLSNNFITSKGFKVLFSALQGCSHLALLKISKNRVSDASQALTSLITRKGGIPTLVIDHCNISQLCFQVPCQIQHLHAESNFLKCFNVKLVTKLRTLMLDDSQITPEMLGQLPGSIQTISLKHNGLTHRAITALLRQQLSLRRANFSHNDLRNSNIQFSGSLVELDLSSTRLQTCSLGSYLHEVNLSNNNLSRECISKMGKLLRNPSCHLRRVSLNNCGLNDESAILLAHCLKENIILSRLQLKDNLIKKQSIESLLLSMRNNFTVEYLLLSGNMLLLEDQRAIARFLARNRQLNSREQLLFEVSELSELVSLGQQIRQQQQEIQQCEEEIRLARRMIDRQHSRREEVNLMLKV